MQESEKKGVMLEHLPNNPKGLFGWARAPQNLTCNADSYSGAAPLVVVEQKHLAKQLLVVPIEQSKTAEIAILHSVPIRLTWI
jgi:hypothetical protein